MRCRWYVHSCLLLLKNTGALFFTIWYIQNRPKVGEEAPLVSSEKQQWLTTRRSHNFFSKLTIRVLIFSNIKYMITYYCSPCFFEKFTLPAFTSTFTPMSDKASSTSLGTPCGDKPAINFWFSSFPSVKFLSARILHSLNQGLSLSMIKLLSTDTKPPWVRQEIFLFTFFSH